MLPAHRAYLIRETAVSIGVNSVLSLLFALLISHSKAALPLWGPGGMAFDFVPQLFMMTFATALAVTLLTRMRLKRGQVASLGERRPPLPRNALLRAILFGLLAVLVLAPLSIGVLALLGVTSATPAPFILGKVIYGAVVSVLIAPPITLAALSAPKAAPLSGDLTQ